MINDILSEARSKMKSTVSVFEDKLSGVRSGRASTALVDRLPVEYYGQETELRQLANISTPEPMQIMIRPFDKGAVTDIEKAIQRSDIGVNPNVDGDVIRLNMPPLTMERRQELVKFVNKLAEEARVAIRNIRRNSIDDLRDFEKEGMISEDELKRGQDEVQKLTDDFIKIIDEMSKKKEQEILEI
ncbi:MAG: ribosome recycling factor [Chloroflexi bacterium]|nr:MAG: ribosome recycling factor [Chloroflexota bacterium]